MLQNYKNSHGKPCVRGTSEGLDFASYLVRAKIYSILGKDEGETFFRKLPAYKTMRYVAYELDSAMIS